MRKWAYLIFCSDLCASGAFTQLGTSYQDTRSLYSAGDSASATGRYFTTQLTLGYESKNWDAGVSVPYAIRNSSAQYQYTGVAQPVSTTTEDSGMSDPALWGSADIFAGNFYAPAVSLFAAVSAPLGKSTLGLQTWHTRPGVAFEYPIDALRLSARFYAEIPFAPNSSVADEYRAYAGTGLTASYPLLRWLLAGADLNYAAGDFSRSAASLRAGGFFSLPDLTQNLSLYVASQVEVVRSDRDVFVAMSVRFNLSGLTIKEIPGMGS